MSGEEEGWFRCWVKDVEWAGKDVWLRRQEVNQGIVLDLRNFRRLDSSLRMSQSAGETETEVCLGALVFLSRSVYFL